jgi:hypothetical protein
VSDPEAWLAPFLARRTPDVIRILTDLVQAGLARGECSANDVRDVNFAEVNIVGASFKCLRSLGFVTTGEVLKSNKPLRHAGMIMRWRLDDRRKAEVFLESQRRLIGVTVKESRQMKEELFSFDTLPSGAQVIS